MTNTFLIVLAIILIIYSFLNFYIGTRIIEGIQFLVPSVNSKYFWICYLVVIYAYILGRIILRYYSTNILAHFLTIIGSFWLAAFYYFVLLFSFSDLLKFLFKITVKSTGFIPLANYTNAGIFIIVMLLIGYGAWHALQPVVRHYEININKKAGNLKSIHVVALSDIHLGEIVGKKQLQKLVRIINGLNPDIVLISGDIIDESVTPFSDDEINQILKEIKSQYGTYAVLGNHEYISRQPTNVINALKEAGITVLQDNHVKIKDSFYIIGRDDRSRTYFYSTKRKNLKEILQGLDHKLPMILLDHQPTELKEAEDNEIDLQISGHTHRGQFFPNQLITHRIFENDWGYLKKGNFQIIVTSGYGTWGPPIRIGTDSEILDININFNH